MRTGLGALYEHYSSKWPHSLPDSLILLARAAFREEQSEACAFLGHTSVREDKAACKRLSPGLVSVASCQSSSAYCLETQVATAPVPRS